MNIRKMIAIVFIWLIVSGGWMVLGTVVTLRTTDVLAPDRERSQGVAKLWGEPQVQKEPTALPADDPKAADVQPITRSVVTARIDAENRQRGLRWFPVYTVDFKGEYTVSNNSGADRPFTIIFARPATGAEFSAQSVTVDGEPQPAWSDNVTRTIPDGKSVVVAFAYRSTGTESWTYDLPDAQMVRDLSVTVSMNRLDYDFDLDGSPPDKRDQPSAVAGHYDLVWHKQLITNARDIKVLMPTRAQPGSLVSRITYFAPVCLFFFFVVMIAIQVVRRLQLHPMHYLFLAAAFFAFDLLLAYLVDHLDIHASFWISAAASVFLVVMYLWLVAGPKTAVLYAGLSQLVYLVLFSYSFFLENFTGLTVTIGAVLTLAVLMVLTARVRWGEEMPELERKRQGGWVPVAPVAGAAGGPTGPGENKEMPGFLGEKNGKRHDDA